MALLMTMEIDDIAELEVRLDVLVDGLLGPVYCSDNEIFGDYLYVKVFRSPWWKHDSECVWRSNYELAVLEPGAEEIAKRIYLDWLFS